MCDTRFTVKHRSHAAADEITNVRRLQRADKQLDQVRFEHWRKFFALQRSLVLPSSPDAGFGGMLIYGGALSNTTDWQLPIVGRESCDAIKRSAPDRIHPGPSSGISQHRSGEFRVIPMSTLDPEDIWICRARHSRFHVTVRAIVRKSARSGLVAKGWVRQAVKHLFHCPLHSYAPDSADDLRGSARGKRGGFPGRSRCDGRKPARCNSLRRYPRA